MINNNCARRFVPILSLSVAAITIGVFSGTGYCTEPQNSHVGFTCMKPAEKAELDAWVSANLLQTSDKTSEQNGLLFSFVYGGKSSAELLKDWKRELSTTKLDENRTQYVQKWTDPATGLEVRCKAVVYSDFPTVEWTVLLTSNIVKYLTKLSSGGGVKLL